MSRSTGRTLGSAIGGCLAVALALVASRASAQEDRQDSLTLHHHSYESSQYFAAELRISPYRPAIDSDPSLHGCTPFADTFGTGPSIMVGAEFDWQALRIPHFGSLGPGVGVSTASFSAQAPFSSSQTSVGGCLKSSGTLSGEQTSLTVYPMFAVAVLRVDVLWKDVGVPFVPYAKLGLSGGLWQATNTLGTSNYRGAPGQGFSLGSQFAVGVGFNLNVLDPYSARNFDEAMGVNGTYLFAEFADAQIDGLGLQSNPLRIGGTTWTFGLSWDF